MIPRPDNPLIVALDVSDPDEADRLGSTLASHVGMVKVGLELAWAAGPGAGGGRGRPAPPGGGGARPPPPPPPGSQGRSGWGSPALSRTPPRGSRGPRLRPHDSVRAC